MDYEDEDQEKYEQMTTNQLFQEYENNTKKLWRKMCKCIVKNFSNST
jgi:hypothetical protein